MTPALQPLLQAIATGTDKIVFAERLGEALAEPTLSAADLAPMIEVVFGSLEHPLQGATIAIRNTNLKVAQALEAWCATHYPQHWARQIPRLHKPKQVFLDALKAGEWATLDALADRRQVAPEIMGAMLNAVVGTGTVQDLDTYATWLRARITVRRTWWDDAQVQAVKRGSPDLLAAILRQPEAVGAQTALMIALQAPERMALINPLLQALPLNGAQQVIQFGSVYAMRMDAKKVSQALPYRQAMDALTALLPAAERPALFARYPGVLPQAEARHQAELREQQLKAIPATPTRPRRTRT